MAKGKRLLGTHFYGRNNYEVIKKYLKRCANGIMVNGILIILSRIFIVYSILKPSQIN